ncbi:tRNA methyltransferase 2 [Apophysomyces ossiformis]|uniref:tRNA methyltransferase 2 n=1 Tax=Apophysomyces ossiformis TaxID=679940 RepID=A0A8H7BL95_9FUNG|nr:tRNA methyltransferase 2 [Apophysomyces ossiformis]
MLKYAYSLVSSVFSRKRSFEDEEQEEQSQQQKKVKMEEDQVIHRVKVNNLPGREVAVVKKLFQSMGLSRFKKAPKWDYAYITCDTEEEAQEVIKKLDGYEFKKRVLKAEYVSVTRQEHSERFQRNDKKAKGEQAEEEEDTRPPAERLADQVTPFHKMPYEEQLKKKGRNGAKQLMNLKKQISQLRDLSEIGKKQSAWAHEKQSMPCPYEDIIASPNVNGYRTKCEFTIGHNLEGEATVGFLLGLYRHGVTAVLSPNDCLHVPDVAKKIAKAMENYVRASSLAVYDRTTKVGVWRTMMTRTQRTGEVMVLIQMKTADMSEEEVEEEKKKLISYWTGLKDKPEEEKVDVTTLLLQIWDGDSNGITPKGKTEVLVGDGYVHEEILGCKFRISSSAFFQINTPATELLYAKCAEWCNIDQSKKTTLLDLCCGTGTIGITMAKSVDQVIGVEMVPEAIVDAKINAELNNIKNVTYYASKVEDCLGVVTGAENEDVVAVLDPPRNGVHASVIRAVRESPHINRIIYISCDAKQALPNFVSLCRPQSNRFRGLPFKPSRAVSLDLFPHTDHSELMIEFVRMDEPESESEEKEE